MLEPSQGLSTMYMTLSTLVTSTPNMGLSVEKLWEEKEVNLQI